MQNITKIPLNELRQMWTQAWEKEAHARIGRAMLEKSLEYKLKKQQAAEATADHQTKLSELIKKYRRNPSSFGASSTLKPGTRLMRTHEGKKHSVLVKADGFEYAGKNYTSLSSIANDITGNSWNGWVFFGLKKDGKK